MHLFVDATCQVSVTEFLEGKRDVANKNVVQANKSLGFAVKSLERLADAGGTKIMERLDHLEQRKVALQDQ